MHFRITTGRSLGDSEFPGRWSIRTSTIEFADQAVENLKSRVKINSPNT